MYELKDWPLLTEWAKAELTKLRKQLVDVERHNGLKPGIIYGVTKPIHVHIALLRFAFHPERKRKTGRVRALLVLKSHARNKDDAMHPNKCWIGLGTIMREAGFADRKNARRNIDELVAANVITKDAQEGRKTNIYTLADGKFVDLAFASAKGAMGLYALVLRELRIDDDGAGVAHLSRSKVRRALAEGAFTASGELALDRRMSDDTVVELIGELRKEDLLLMTAPSKLTIPPALAPQQPVLASRLWQRADAGKGKRQQPLKTTLGGNITPTCSEGVITPTQVSLAGISLPIDRTSARISPPELLAGSKLVDSIELPDIARAGSSARTPTPPSGSGMPSPSPAGNPMSATHSAGGRAAARLLQVVGEMPEAVLPNVRAAQREALANNGGIIAAITANLNVNVENEKVPATVREGGDVRALRLELERTGELERIWSDLKSADLPIKESEWSGTGPKRAMKYVLRALLQARAFGLDWPWLLERLPKATNWSIPDYSQGWSDIGRALNDAVESYVIRHRRGGRHDQNLST